ncbi:hypothetical protein [Streptomyces sp. Isolate_45]|uniref:hypothetical protein n=1 Tax=Streptomyces sp. Isolate_45 TaxID=2950111 RepID=UPI00248204D7|nr:hypothetical protein [Streptomyces sp. Isolate_45]MDA5284627.1 hypothetical protein [Streptomyces sp. Isolate_45]
MTDLPALDPAHLYRHAPDLLTEAAELLTVSSHLLTQTFAGDPVDEEYERDYYLRRSVQADRVALSHPGPRTLETAEEAARTLAAFDRMHPHLAPTGITVPDQAATGDEVRAHTRACYNAAPWT